MTHTMIRSQYVENAKRSNRRAIQCKALGYHDLAKECRDFRDWWMALVR